MAAAGEAVASAQAPFAKLRPGPGRPAAQVAENQSARILAAMVELTVDHGYRAVKVRDLVRLAGVSTRTFYERFADKEDCLLRAHGEVMQRAVQRPFASHAYAHELRERQRLIIAAFLRELACDPKGAHVALIDARDGGPKVLEHVQRSERSFEALLSKSLGYPPDGVSLPGLVVEGMAAGILEVTRSRLRANRTATLGTLQRDLASWTLCYVNSAVTALAELDSKSIWRNTALQPLSTPGAPGNGAIPDDRALILVAMADLLVTDGYSAVTTSRICARAGIPREKFSQHFADVDDCLLATLELRSNEAIAQIARAKEAGRTWPGGIYRAIAALADHIANDPLLAGICLCDDFTMSPGASRARHRAITALIEQLLDCASCDRYRSGLFSEATGSAVWTLICRHIAGRPKLDQRASIATISYVALAPAVGAPAALAAISDEQAHGAYA